MRRRLSAFRVPRRIAVLGGVLVLALGVGAGAVVADPGHWFSSDNAWPYNDPGHAPVLAAVGDISCQPGSPQEAEKATDVCTGGTAANTRDAAQNATAEQVEAMHPALVAVLGDEQYQNGQYSDFENSFDKYWGAFKMIQRPAPGNHEYYDNHGQTGVRGLGYFDYYNGITHGSDGSENDTTVTNPSTGHSVVQPTPQTEGQAGATGNGWYSYNLGAWHMISLNIECEDQPGGCTTADVWFNTETKWLEQDLEQNNRPCVAAYWHQPTFSSTAGASANGMGDSADGELADLWWKILYDHHATLVLNGHDHVYTRFAPMDPTGTADPKHGIREFIIGTGGEALDTLASDPSSTTKYPDPSTVQASADKWYGVMQFTLGHGWYKWDYRSAMEDPKFVTATSPATSYDDSGEASCNSPRGIGH